MKKLLSVITVLIFVVFSASAQTADKTNQHQLNHSQKKQLKKDLHLTKDQAQQLKQFRQESKGEVKAIKEDQSMTKAQKHEKLAALKTARQEKMNSILTKEQQQKLAQFRQANKNKHKSQKV